MKNFTQESDVVWFMFLKNYSDCYENKYLRRGQESKQRDIGKTICRNPGER